MTVEAKTKPYVIISVQSYNLAKGIMYGKRVPDGKSLIIKKDPRIQRDFVSSLGNKKLKTYAPKGALIALFDAQMVNEQSGQMITSSVATISKNPEKENIYVTPVKVSFRPERLASPQANNSTYMEATVLDEAPVSISDMTLIRQTIVRMIKGQGGRPILNGERGFMIRYGFTGPDGSTSSSGFEFYQRKGESPEETIERIYNAPANGGKVNLFRGLLFAIRETLKKSNGFVHVCGLTKARVNDYGSDENNTRLAKLPNFKANINGNHQATWSLAAFTTAKSGSQQFVNKIIPLPKYKVITNPSGLLGKHSKDESIPFRLNETNASIAISKKVAPPASSEPAKGFQPAKGSQPAKGFPLTINDFINGKGKNESFNVWGNPAALEKWHSRIFKATGSSTKPYKNSTGGFSFPKFYRPIVESNLSDLLGTPAIYIDNYKIGDQRYIAFRGRYGESPFAEGIANLAQKFEGRVVANGLTVFPEHLRTKVISDAGYILRSAATQEPIINNLERPAKTQVRKKSKNGTSYPERETFPDWLDRKFGNDPHAMMSHLSNDISKVAAQAGIDWESTASSVVFDTGDVLSKKKGYDIIFNDSAHNGSVAIGAETTESTWDSGTLKLFYLNFINKKIMAEGAFLYNPFHDLKSLYDSEVWQKKASNIPDANKEKLKQEAERRNKEAEIKRAANIEDYYLQLTNLKDEFPELSKDIYRHSYYNAKGLHGLEKYIDLRISNEHGNPELTYQILDINLNLAGAQRLLDKPYYDKKGKKNNKLFNAGFAFSNPETGEVLGAHCIIGEVRPNEPIGFVEGLADGYTAFKARGHAIVVCLSKSNMDNVIHLYRSKHPNNDFLVFGDNDIYNPKNGNPGAMAALEASYKYKVDYSLPRFNGLPATTKPKDFNDLEKIAGLDLVKSQMANLWHPPETELHYQGSRIMYCGLGKLEKEIISAISAIRNSQAFVRETDDELESIFIEVALTVHSPQDIQQYATELWAKHGPDRLKKNTPLAETPVATQANQDVSVGELKITNDHRKAAVPLRAARTEATQTQPISISSSNKSLPKTVNDSDQNNTNQRQSFAEPDLSADAGHDLYFNEPNDGNTLSNSLPDAIDSSDVNTTNQPDGVVEKSTSGNEQLKQENSGVQVTFGDSFAQSSDPQISINSNGNYTLVQFQSAEQRTRIQEALQSLFPNKKPIYNEVLQGFIAPHESENLLRSYLYEDAGAPRLYFGRPLSSKPGRCFIVRGDFSDSSFRREIEQALSLATPIFKPEEFGYEINNIDALGFVESAIARHLSVEEQKPNTTPQKPFIEQKINGVTIPQAHSKIEPVESQIDIPKESNGHALALSQAMDFSGLSKIDILNAHVKLSKNEPGLLSKSNYSFAAIYARQEKSFTSQSAASQHTLALGATLLEVNTLLSNISKLNPVVAAQLFEAEKQFSLLSTQINSTQANSTQVNSTQVNSTQVNSTQVNSTQVNSTQANSTQVNSSQINSSQINSSQINSSQINSSQINSSQINSSQINSSQINSSQINSSQINSSQINSSQINAVAEQPSAALSSVVTSDPPATVASEVSSANIGLTSTINEILSLSDALLKVNTQLERMHELNPLIAAKLGEASQLHTMQNVQPAEVVPEPAVNENLSVLADSNIGPTNPPVSGAGQFLPDDDLFIFADNDIDPANPQNSGTDQVLPADNTIIEDETPVTPATINDEQDLPDSDIDPANPQDSDTGHLLPRDDLFIFADNDIEPANPQTSDTGYLLPDDDQFIDGEIPVTPAPINDEQDVADNDIDPANPQNSDAGQFLPDDDQFIDGEVPVAPSPTNDEQDVADNDIDPANPQNSDAGQFLPDDDQFIDGEVPVAPATTNDEQGIADNDIELANPQNSDTGHILPDDDLFIDGEIPVTPATINNEQDLTGSDIDPANPQNSGQDQLLPYGDLLIDGEIPVAFDTINNEQDLTDSDIDPANPQNSDTGHLLPDDDLFIDGEIPVTPATINKNQDLSGSDIAPANLQDSDEKPNLSEKPYSQETPLQGGFNFDAPSSTAPSSTEVENNAFDALIDDDVSNELQAVADPVEKISDDFIPAGTNDNATEVSGEPSQYPQPGVRTDHSDTIDENLITINNAVNLPPIDDGVNPTTNPASVSTTEAPPNFEIDDAIAPDFVTNDPQRKPTPQEARAITLLAFTRQFIKTDKMGHKVEHFVDKAIKSVGSPYYDTRTQTFDQASLAEDIKYVSNNNVPTWKNIQTVSTPSSLYYALYNEIAAERLAHLNDYIFAYLGSDRGTHDKTFMKYFKGKLSLDLEVENPYLVYGTYDEDFLNSDLQFFTEFQSVNEYYRDLADQFKSHNLDNSASVTEQVGKIEVFPRKLEKDTSTGEEYFQTSIVFDGLNIECRETVNAPLNDTKYLLITAGGGIREGDNKAPILTETLNAQTLFSETMDDQQFRLKKVLIGSLKLYVVEDVDKSGVNIRPYDDFLAANQAYKRLLKTLPEILTVSDVSAKTKPTLSPADIHNKIKTYIEQNVSFRDAIEGLKDQFSIELVDEKALEGLYNEWVVEDKAGPLPAIDPEERFKAFHQFISSLATAEMLYDECFDEAFKAGGAYYESNPYFDVSSARVDTRASRKDLKENGYRSFKMFYEDVFSGINHRESHEIVLARAGGYIPSSYDINGPIGLQYSQLSSLLTENASTDALPLHLPTFKAWIGSDDALAAIHPILSVNLTNISANQLTDKYTIDALLLLADVHGAPITKDDDKHAIATRVLDIWLQRRRLASTTVDEFSGMSVDELTLIATDIGLTTVSNRYKMAQQIVSHLDILRDNSHLRLAQYSYIKAALGWEKAGRQLPSYVKRNIHEITTNESIYRSDAKEIVKKVEMAKLREDIAQQLASMEQLEPIARKLYALQAFPDKTMVGLSETDFVKEGAYRYRLVNDADTASLSMPEGISYYNVLDEKMIATPTPLPSDYMARNKLTPITDKAVIESLSSIKQWIETQGYGAFYQQATGQLIVIHPVGFKNGYFLDTFDTDNKMDRLHFSSLDSALVTHTEVLNGFCDRDIIAEDYIELIDQDLFNIRKSLLAKLKSTHSPEVAEASIDTLVASVASQSEQMALLINDHAGESGKTILQSIIASQLAQLSELAYQKVLGIEIGEKTTAIRGIDSAIDIVVNEIADHPEESAQPPEPSLNELIPLKAKLGQSDNNSSYLAALSQSLALSLFKADYYKDMPLEQANKLALLMASGTYEGQWQMLHHQWVIRHGTDTQIAALNAFYNPSSEAQQDSAVQQQIEVEGIELKVGTSVYCDSDGGLIGILSEIAADSLVIEEHPLAFEITKAEVSNKDRQVLFNEKGEGLYSKTFHEYIFTPRHAQKNEFSEIDKLVNELPLTVDANARQQLSNGLGALSLSQLSKYARETGTIYTGDRTTISEGIYDQALVLQAIANTNEEPESLFYSLDDVEKERFTKFFGNTSMDNWQQIANEKSRANIGLDLRTEYSLMLLTAQRYGYIRNGSNFSGKTITLNNANLLTPIASKQMFDTLLKQQVDALWVDNVLSHGENNTQIERAVATWLSQLSNLTPDAWHTAISNSISSITFEPMIEDATIMWRGKDHNGQVVTNAYSSVIGAIEEADLKAIPIAILEMDTPVAWIDEADNLQEGITIDEVTLSNQNDELSVYVDFEGDTQIQDISLARLTVIDPQANANQFNTILRDFSGNFDSLISNIKTQKTQALENKAWQNAILLSFVLENARLLKQSYQEIKTGLNDGDDIVIDNGRFLLTTPNETGDVKPVFDTLADLEKNQIIRKRINVQNSIGPAGDGTEPAQSSKEIDTSADKPKPGGPNSKQESDTNATKPVGINSQTTPGTIPATDNRKVKEPGGLGRSPSNGTGEIGKHGSPYANPVREEQSATELDELPGSTQLPTGDGQPSERDGTTRNATRRRGLEFFLPQDLEQLVSGSARHRADLNMAALYRRKAIKEKSREVTDQDRDVLVKYSGWGGLTSILAKAPFISALKQLVNNEELDSIYNSSLTAFYTPPGIIHAMWRIAKQLGFDGGKFFDPSTGTGHFIGSAPEEIAANTVFSARELDNVTADIAKMLYGDDIVKHQGYENARIPKNYFDLMMSNIPFGDFKVFDTQYRKDNHLIHDYFIIKSLDKVREGGVVGFITSTGTMDKVDPTVREKIAGKADLLGAIRLPRKTFSQFAGTEVSADILFFQKRHLQDKPKNVDWIMTSKKPFVYSDPEQENEYDLHSINDYFVSNPEMIIGDPVSIKGQFGRELGVIFSADDIPAEINNRISLFPQGVIAKKKPQAIKEQTTSDYQPVDFAHAKPGTHVVQNGEILILEPVYNAVLEEYELTPAPSSVPKTQYENVMSMIALRDHTRGHIQLQLNDASKAEFERSMTKLNELYDNYVSNKGYLNDKANKSAFRNDPDAALLLALENYDGRTGTATKTDIFSIPTIRDQVTINKADSPQTALQTSLGVKGRVDTQYIESLLGQSWDVIHSHLKNDIYLNPETNEWESSAHYLSGNIRIKLDIAEQANEIDPRYQKNVSDLAAIMPTPIEPYEIRVRLGATWIPMNTMSQFIEFIVTGENKLASPEKQFHIARSDASWVVRVAKKLIERDEGRTTEMFGTKRVSADKLIDKLLNSRKIVVNDEFDGKSVVNAQASMEANIKADLIGQAFKDWVWATPERMTELSKIYNDQYNVFVEQKFDGSKLQYPTLSPLLKGKPFVPRPHQSNGVMRYIVDGTFLAAQGVGSGKTFTLCACAVEGKRFGVHKKALMVVPNNILSQFAGMALEHYPNAKVLTLDPKIMKKEHRLENTARIATGEWDMVIMSISSFVKMSTPPAFQSKLIEQEKWQLEETLKGLQNNQNGASRISIKKIKKALIKLEATLLDLSDNNRKDDLLYLDELGIDAILCDEADNFLNLQTSTQMSHIPGVNSSQSLQATAMYMACRYVQEINDNRGVVFATGTDIRNSMSDMYTMMRFLAPDVLASANASTFDSFMGTFGEVVKSIEVNPEGSGYRENSRLSKFINIPELVTMYRQIADIVPSSTLNLSRPNVETVAVAAEPCEWTKRYMSYLSQRARDVRSRMVKPTEDNILKIANGGRLASLDIRLIDKNLPDFEGSKVNICVNNILSEYQSGKRQKLAQLVFCDLGIHKKTNGFSVYEDIQEKLIARGMPADAIAIAQDYDKEPQKKLLEQQINNGDIAVCIASTAKLGVGSNVQQRLVALHNLDAPWRPRDLEQRIGRIERQGNMNDNVRIYNYSTIDSFDLFMWETLFRKAGFIVQIKVDPKNAARELLEDINPTYADVMAITTGNPKIKRKIELDGEVEKLQTLERGHQRNQWESTGQIAHLERELVRFSTGIDFYKREMGKLDGAKMTFSGQTFDNLDKAAQFVKKYLLTRKPQNTGEKPDLIIPLGSFGSMELDLRLDHGIGRYVLRAKGEQTHIVSTNENAVRMVKKLASLASVFEKNIDTFEDNIRHTNKRIESLNAVQGQPFEHKQKLEDSILELQTITRELADDANEQLQQQEESVPFETQLERYLEAKDVAIEASKSVPNPDAFTELLSEPEEDKQGVAMAM